MVVTEGADVGWDNVSEMFSLDPAVIHLSNGTYGAVPNAVQRAQQRVRTEADLNPMRFFATDLLARIGHTRAYVARFLGADPAGTALVANATAGIAIALNTMADRLRPGTQILTTNHGYGSVDIAVQRWCERLGVTAVNASFPVDASEGEILQAFRAALEPGRVRLAVVDQITSPTAQALPLRSILALLREHDAVAIVDGAHAPGQLDLHVDSIGADFWVGNLHKWAFSARGTAALVVAPHWRSRVEPLVVSWGQAEGFPLNVEFGGTLDYSPWLSTPTALHVLRILDPARVRAHNVELVRYGQQALAAAWGHKDLLGSGVEELSMRLVRLPDKAIANGTDQLRREISEKLGIEVAVTSLGKQGFIRLSAQIYNTRSHYDRLAATLPDFLA